MNIKAMYTAHCLLYLVRNRKIQIENRSHEMKNITTANEERHTVAQRISRIEERFFTVQLIISSC